jgi:hypothetical protein
VDPIYPTTFAFTLRIDNSDFDEHPYIIQCEGTAAPTPDMRIEYQSTYYPSGDTVTLGSYTAGIAATVDFTIINDGVADLNLTGNPLVSFPTQSNVNCTLAAAPGTPVSSGGGFTNFTVGFTPAGSGNWVFVLWVENNDTANNPYSITVEGTSPPVTPTQLGVFRQPANANATVAFGTQPIVSVQDANGAVDRSDNSTVIVAALASGPSGAALGGTLTATCVDGYATFSSLFINQEGTGYTLSFSVQGGGLTPTVSQPFDVGPAPPSSGGGGGGDDGGGCSTSTPGLPWLMLCALLAITAVAARRPQRT